MRQNFKMAYSHRLFSKTSSLARCRKTCLTGYFGVQIPRDICNRFGRYLYSTKLSSIVNVNISELNVGGSPAMD